jgi:transcription elongation GreA/GreB family factor
MHMPNDAMFTFGLMSCTFAAGAASPYVAFAGRTERLAGALPIEQARDAPCTTSLGMGLLYHRAPSLNVAPFPLSCGRVLPSKPALKQELLGLVSRDLEILVSALRATREGATHEEAKPENDKDTRALEQSYLARGQAARVEELRAAVEAISRLTTRVFDQADPIALGALATLCDADADPPSEPVVVLVSPHGGGHQLAEGRVRVVTPISPLGRALLGKRVGEQVGLSTRGRERQLEIVSIA